MPDAGIQEARFSFTESAARRIAKLRQDEAKSDAMMMRVAVLGGGCSGFQYQFDFDDVEGFSGTIDKVLVDTDGTIIKKGQAIFKITPDEILVEESPEDIAARRKQATNQFLQQL